MLTIGNYLFLVALAIISWIIICYVKHLETQRVEDEFIEVYAVPRDSCNKLPAINLSGWIAILLHGCMGLYNLVASAKLKNLANVKWQELKCCFGHTKQDTEEQRQCTETQKQMLEKMNEVQSLNKHLQEILTTIQAEVKALKQSNCEKANAIVAKISENTNEVNILKSAKTKTVCIDSHKAMLGDGAVHQNIRTINLNSNIYISNQYFNQNQLTCINNGKMQFNLINPTAEVEKRPNKKKLSIAGAIKECLRRCLMHSGGGDGMTSLALIEKDSGNALETMEINKIIPSMDIYKPISIPVPKLKKFTNATSPNDAQTLTSNSVPKLFTEAKPTKCSSITEPLVKSALNSVKYANNSHLLNSKPTISSFASAGVLAPSKLNLPMFDHWRSENTRAYNFATL